MSDTPQLSGNYHVLLVGIDGYSVKPLSGCVNDIDQIQGLLGEEGPPSWMPAAWPPCRTSSRRLDAAASDAAVHRQPRAQLAAMGCG